MRKFLSIALLASVAVPTVAIAQDDNPRRGERGLNRRAERTEQRAERQAERAEQRVERAPVAPQVQPMERQRQAQPAYTVQADGQGERGRRTGRGGDASRDGRRGGVDAGIAAQILPPAGQAQSRAQVETRDGRRAGRADRNDNDRRDWNGNRNGADARRDWNGNRNGADGRRDWNDGNRNWNGNNRNWNRSWRSDNRYDWQRYRGSNRYAFRLPRYYAPYGYGYGYRRFSIGATLFHGLFAQDYWIGDPYAYRLPPAGWPYQWVRYYDDALLVDTRSGYVVDVIEGIFW
ncbi:MAG: RcnB family protein [Pseudomonadota bacterium]